jgi:hypothetical protein
MREANFSIPSANKASVGITPALYDRRALDCTSTLPLINSLNNLTYLTTSSARIRDILTVDGGVERLVCILKDGRSKDAMESWKWNLAFQCVFNIGVRGSEAVRTRVVEADMVPVVATLLDNYICAMEKLKKRADEDARRTPVAFNPFPNLQSPTRASRSPYQSRPERTPRRSVPPPIDLAVTDDQPMTELQPLPRNARLDFSRHSPMHHVRPQSSPQIRSEQLSRQALRPVRDADRLPSMLPNLNPELSSQPQSPTTPSGTAPASPRSAASLGHRRPSIRHQLSISGNWEDEQSDDAVQDTSDTAETSPEPMVDIQTDINMQDIVQDDTMLEGSVTPVAMNVPTVDVSDSDAFIGHGLLQDGSINNQTPTQTQPGFPPPQQLPSVDIINATPPALMPPRAGAPFVSAPAPLAAALPRDEDVIMSLQLLAYVSKYCNLRSYFQASHLVPRLNIDAELRTLDADYDATLPFAGPTQEELEEAWDNEFVEQPAYNIFPLIEKFTVRCSSSRQSLLPTSAQQSETMQYWAGVVMRNLCRKDESRGGIRQCAYWKCGKWEEYTRQFAKCRRCRRTKYCSKECQKGAWGSHRFWCVAAEEGKEGENSRHHHHHHHGHGHSHPHQRHQQHGQGEGAPTTGQAAAAASSSSSRGESSRSRAQLS